MANDIKVIWDNDLMEGDIVYSNGDLLIEDGLETAVLMSLFTDRRADDEDVLPDNTNIRRGWWGDLAVDSTDKIGSRLWLLERSSTTDENIENCKLYAKEALEWMIEDGVIASVDVESERHDDKLYFKVILYKFEGGTIVMKFDDLWTTQVGE